MKRGIAVLFAVAVCCSTAVLAHDMKDMKGEEGADHTMQGEIVDLACYMGHAAKGEKHAQCAKACISGGAPMGLSTADGNVYLLVNDHQKEKAFKDAQGLAGNGLAKITGHMVNKGGLQAMIVEKAEKGEKAAK
jgi:hypothetical protein